MRARAALMAALAGWIPAAAQAAFELEGTRSVIAVTADGRRLPLGKVQFTPAEESGRVKFSLTLEPQAFRDHFLSMREFKCIEAAQELSCHVPYPYANPSTVSASDLQWLEHSLMFFYKLPSDFGAKLWNGVYFEFEFTPAGLVGRPKAIDLNRIAEPPADLAVPPFRKALRDDMPPSARWIRQLLVE